MGRARQKCDNFLFWFQATVEFLYTFNGMGMRYKYNVGTTQGRIQASVCGIRRTGREIQLQCKSAKNWGYLVF